MTPERFRALTESYGADPARWPEGERAEGQAMAADPGHLAALANAAALDRLLAAHQVAAPEAALQRRIAASAPTPRSPWWWSGLGLAGVGLAGSLAGALLVSAVLATVPVPAAIDLPYASTGFGGMAHSGSEE
ncbi:hypothetical protein OR16_04892 [Cupriavidus basilensis OR16]|uniref:Transmembrane protein n=1 Tax=Cupriavidus basilensis OR16 TaxID=1127483 RepID=H1S063_9BURK|nr:hypothetical protein [Cupriavidus basilensis]EHP43999.1 hypothetical protein OR16_04892 [Cupriavidus basilensis OR16]